MKQRKRRRGGLTLLLGALLMALGALALSLPGDLLQFAFPAPAATQEGNEIAALYETAQEKLASMADSLTAYAVAARRQSVSISSGEGKAAQVTLYAVGEGYFDVMHETLRSGRFVSGADVSRVENVIVIEEKNALALYPGVEPVGQRLTLEGREYEVAGVIAGGRRLGEADEAVAYIPITAAGEHALPMQTVICSARCVDTGGTAILMEDTLSAWQPNGSFYHLAKMRLGAVMPLRWALLIAGVCALLTALQHINALAMGRISLYHERLKTRYARDMAPGIAGSVLGLALLYGLWLALVSALAVFSIEPLYVFTEWVPEVVVELSSLENRFWALNNAHAAAIRCMTRETAVIELGQGLMRWGFMACLLGLALRLSRVINAEAPMPAIRRER